MAEWNVTGYRVRYRKATPIDSGTAEQITTTSLTDSAKSWAPGSLVGCYVHIETETRAPTDRTRQIANNTATTIIFEEELATSGAGESYLILRPEENWNIIATDLYPYVQIKGLPEGAYVICQVAAVPHTTRR